MDNSKDSITILDLPPNEKPRERLAKVGEKNLSNAELLAIILRTGSKGNTAIDLATNLLRKYNGDMKQLFSADIQELSKIKGIGLAKAAQIKACFELARRMFEKKKHIQEVISLLMPEMPIPPRGIVWCLRHHSEHVNGVERSETP